MRSIYLKAQAKQQAGARARPVKEGGHALSQFKDTGVRGIYMAKSGAVTDVKSKTSNM